MDINYDHKLRPICENQSLLASESPYEGITLFFGGVALLKNYNFQILDNVHNLNSF